MLLATTRAHAGFAIWPTGEQALANIMRIMDQARRYEARGGTTSFRAFVDELEARAERDEASETPIVEEGTEGIRIMTVHRAKGLEFPVVILADITCNETRADASRYIEPASKLAAMELAGCAPRELQEHQAKEHDRDVEESIRLLYVAATRARDLIVVPAVGDEESDGWLARLNPVVYPAQTERRAPLSAHPAGCPEFGDDSVLTRPAEGAGQSEIGGAGITSRAKGRASDRLVGSAAADPQRRGEDGAAAGQAAAGRRQQARVGPRRQAARTNGARAGRRCSRRERRRG